MIEKKYLKINNRFRLNTFFLNFLASIERFWDLLKLLVAEEEKKSMKI